MRRVERLIGSLMALSMGLLLFSGVAFAQDARSYQKDVTEYKARVEKIKSDGDTSRYSSELKQIDSWIDESFMRIGEKDADKVKELVMKIGVYVDFVDASMKRDVAVGRAMEAESRLKTLKSDYGKLEAQVQQLAAEEEVVKTKLGAAKN